MYVHFLDPYHPRPSLIHQLDARVKFVFVVAFIFTASLMPSGVWAGYLILAAIIFSAELLSEMGIGFYLRRAILALPFALAAISLPFTVSGHPLFEFTLGSWLIQTSLEGTIRFLSIAVKSWISVQAAILLAVTTPFPDILLAMRYFRLPRLLVAIFGLMWRYIFVLADEALRLMRARASRSALAVSDSYRPGRSLVWRAKITGSMAGSLFLRAFERADRIYVAMLSRGYDGDVRSISQPPLGRPQWLLLWIGVSFLVILLVIAQLLSGLG